MATKAELEAELKALRKQMASHAKDAAETVEDAGSSAQDAAETLAEMLKSHGISKEDAQELWGRVSQELGEIPQNKPLLMSVGAFSIGFALGRLSK
jgi:hypothetical protein